MLSFGLNRVYDSELDKLYLHQGAMLPVVTEMVTRKAYHMDTGICDYSTDDPLDLVRLHPKENIIEGGPRRTWQRKFVNYRIGSFTNLNITEFFDLPFDDACFYVELAESKSIQEAAAARTMMNNLQD